MMMQDEFQLDNNLMFRAGATQGEVNAVWNIYLNIIKYENQTGKRISFSQSAKDLGISQSYISRLQKLMKIGVQVSPEISSLKPLLSSYHYGENKTSIQDLRLSSISKSDIVKKVVIGNIRNSIFSVYNYHNYKNKPGTTGVFDVASKKDKSDLLKLGFSGNTMTSTYVVIKTNIAPVVATGQLMSDQYGEVLGRINYSYYVKINRRDKDNLQKVYVMPLNYFLVTASVGYLPERYLYLIKILLYDGVVINVYAKTIEDGKDARYSERNQRIYDYSFYGSDIAKQVRNVSATIFNKLKGVLVEEIGGNILFNRFNTQIGTEELEEEIL